MDHSTLDSVAKYVAASANRRSLLRGMAVGAFGAFGLRQAGASAQGRERVTICHLTPRGDYRQISVIPEAVRTHEEHPGDIINPDFLSNENCGGCGIVCADGESCGGGGEPGVCGHEPGAEECPAYMTPNPNPGENPCWFPCDLNGCPKCESGACIAHPDGSAYCVVNSNPEEGLAWGCVSPEIPCNGPAVQLWLNLGSNPNEPLCGTWQDASACLASEGSYTLEACSPA